MGNLSGYDANDFDPNGANFDPLPKNDYLAEITASEFKATKNNDGEYLQLTFCVLDGEFKGRTLFDRLNLKNANETAVKIANSTLSAICHSVGVMRPNDSAELHGKPIVISVDVEERNDKPGAFSNRIKGYKATNAVASAPVAATKDAKTPPWKKK
jgi:hypothetical protein